MRKSSDTAVVCIAGFFLRVIKLARWDAQHSTFPVLDTSGSRPVLASETTRHKLANTVKRKTTILRFVCFGRGQFSLVERQILGTSALIVPVKCLLIRVGWVEDPSELSLRSRK